jgi:hypothetical protein
VDRAALRQHADVPDRLPAPITSSDLDLFRVVIKRSGQPVESELRGTSMGLAIPSGSRIRIFPTEGTSCRPGHVVAFLAGSRVMVHRVLYAGRRGRAQMFLITQGDGNWMCDPPVRLETIAGRVEEFCVNGTWQPVGPASYSLVRRVVSFPPLALMRVALEWNPSFAEWIARGMTQVRMGAGGIWMKVRQRLASGTRHR